ncbi:pentatricopeptide repeat-containing protein DOT4, chloroplastic [Impatiens glandulifera]|uniref:pentatricopeptide repeat-containing protein DOT4, chloroplastic n=1 Tax=Impatiens glandulifera TaxID=253017 RepID=UPI001FB0CB76|nr:pentatricopeptide repeat-containing protein DOT4, chloroplastic [Impatiens glandulifera]
MATVMTTNVCISIVQPSSSYFNHQNASISFSRTSKISRTSLKSRQISSILSQSTCQQLKNYNSEIIESCNATNLKTAMDSLHRAEKSEIELETYCSILQLCADMNSLDNGRKVHYHIDYQGMNLTGILGSKLVFMYVKCGDLREGRRILDLIDSKNVFLWNLLMNEYAKSGYYTESLVLYRRMLEIGIEPDSYTFTCVFKCFAFLGYVLEGQIAHGLLLKKKFGSYNMVSNSIIAFYFKTGRIESACKVFDEMSNRDVVTWNSMISGYVTNNLPYEGLKIFNQMFSVGIEIDLATMINALAACADVGLCSFGSVLHCYGVKTGIIQDTLFCNSLLDMYSKSGETDNAIRVFEGIGERCVVSWTSMIAGYAREGLSDKAIMLFWGMVEKGIEPDVFTITTILNSCSCSGSLENGREIHNYVIENNLESNLSVCNALIDMYTKCGDMKDAQSVFELMPVKDIITWNTMIGGCSKNSLQNVAISLFLRMQEEERIKPDNVTVSCVLPACASLSAFDRGREIHGYVTRNEMGSDPYVANAVIDMYVKCGSIDIARKVFDEMAVRDLFSWTIMIAGYCMHGLGNEAIATLKKMKKGGFRPDEISFISILCGCNHSGLWKEGEKLFEIMRKDYKIEPKMEHYACMADLLARAGKLSDAFRFIKSMPIKPDVSIWRNLLSACGIHRDVKLAEEVAERVFELEPENSEYYVMLASIYADAEKWGVVKKPDEGKNSGRSWIEVKGKVHIFLRDSLSSHNQSRRINAILKGLTKNMKVDGWISKVITKEAKKEVAACGHSEKLAMAFGILSLPPGKTIRVTKNEFKICPDCHEMAKYMSKTVAREIVLRDSNRFHHFKNGICSCRR